MRDLFPAGEGEQLSAWEGAGTPGMAPKLQLLAQGEQQREFGSLRAGAFPEQGGNCSWDGQGRGDFLGIEVLGIGIPVTPLAAQLEIPPLSFAHGKANSSQGKKFPVDVRRFGRAQKQIPGDSRDCIHMEKTQENSH